MKGVILKQEEKHFTYLKDLFFHIGNVQKRYNWLLTDYECYPQNPNYVKILSEDYCWITGEELTEMIEDENFQWIWGVFSAFPKHICKDEVVKYRLPQAEGNRNLWIKPISVQHPLAELEITAWDSSMTIFISKRDDIVDTLQKNNTFTEDLEEYNKML